MLFVLLITLIQAESIPISIDVDSMVKEKTGCNTDKQCTTTNIISDCGSKCWGKTANHYFQYTFRGVKFEVYGSIQTSNGNFSLFLDNEFVQSINLKGTTNILRTLVYTSNILPYGDHTIKAQGIGQQFEIYKFTYWPSLTAKRLNASDFSSKGSWTKESDQIGGVREVTSESNAKKTAFIPTSKIWVYGKKNSGYGNLDIRIGDKVQSITQNNGNVNNDLLFELDLLSFKEYVISLENPSSNGQKSVSFNCIYYEYDPPLQTPAPNPSRSPIPSSGTDYIDKVFINSLPNGNIEINSQSASKQISGCKFINVIRSTGQFLIAPKVDFPFYDNWFEFTGPNYNSNSMIWTDNNVHTFTITNCMFKNVRYRQQDTEGTIYSSNTNIALTFDSCTFINCGVTGSKMLKAQDGRNVMKFLDSTFYYDDPSNAAKICNFHTSNVQIDGCTFIRPSINMIHLESPVSNNGAFKFTNNVVEYCTKEFITTANLNQKPEISGNTFRNIKMETGILISFGHSMTSIDLVNNTFTNITSAKGSYGGGIASLFRHQTSSTKVTLKFDQCHFYDIKNANDASPYNIGGAFQYGGDQSLINTEIIFSNCEFKRNTCMNGKGGALGINIKYDLTISDCTFEDNQGSAEGGAIFISRPSSEASIININHCIFRGNKGSDGSAIFIDETNTASVKLTVSDCSFVNNGELNNGFMIVCKCGELFLENNNFEFSDKTKTSGAIQSVNPTKVTIIDSNFTNCIVNAAASVLLQGQSQTALTTITNCKFVECKANSYSIQISGGTSEVDSVTVSFESTSFACGAIDFGNRGFICQNSFFIHTNAVGSIMIEQENGDTNKVVVDGCTFDGCEGSNRRCFNIVIKTTDFTFSNNVIRNMVKSGKNGFIGLIDGPSATSTTTLQNITLIDNTCDSFYGGGTGLWISSIGCITFDKCKFINNVAHKCSEALNVIPTGMTSYYNGDGGGIQYGLTNSIYNVDMVFDGCLFKQNKAVRHGGAIALQTIKTVQIINCIFDSNEANYNTQSSAELMYENHFNKKTEGRGGAIYINPTFSYENVNGKMQSVNIQGCTFISNRAFDGYAIYIEGESDGTTFTITNNVFTDNYIKGSPRAGKSIIATEIIDLTSLDIESNNVFNYTEANIRIEPLLYVDHYGIAFPPPSSTPIPPNVEVVNTTKDNNVQPYIITIYFDHLIESGSIKLFLNCSVCTVKTDIYIIISFENQEISGVEYDPREILNGETIEFFVNRDGIKYDKETKSLSFPSGSASIFLERYENNLLYLPLTDIILYENDCITNKDRCEVIVEDKKPIHVFVIVSTFNQYDKNQNDGGAIHLENCCLTCKDTNFNKCEIKEGGGGAIYIKNELDYTNNVTLEFIKFEQCKAEYGGAVYIHLNSFLVPLRIRKCTFSNNEVTKNDDSILSGGSAIYLNVVTGYVSFCKFKDNIGSISTTKIVNSAENSLMLLSSPKSTSISFVDCEYEVAKNEKSAMQVVIGKVGSIVEIDHCTFKGDLANDGHYIVEKILGDKSNALKIRSCKFFDDEKKSFDLDKKQNMKMINLSNMVFNLSNEKKKELCSWKFLASIVVPVFAILFLLVVFAIINLNRNKDAVSNKNDFENPSL